MTTPEAIADIVENICVAASVIGCVWMWLRFLRADE